MASSAGMAQPQPPDAALFIADMAMKECNISAKKGLNSAGRIEYVKGALQAKADAASRGYLQRFEYIDKLQKVMAKALKGESLELRALDRLNLIIVSLQVLGPKICAERLMRGGKEDLVVKAVAEIAGLKKIVSESKIKTQIFATVNHVLAEIENERKQIAVIPPGVTAHIAANLTDEEQDVALAEMLGALSIGSADAQKSVAKAAKKERAKDAVKMEEKEIILNAIADYLQGKTKTIVLPQGKENIGKEIYDFQTRVEEGGGNVVDRLRALLGRYFRSTPTTADEIATVIEFLAKQCPKLYTLDFTDTQVDKKAIAHFPKFQHLENLSFGNCSHLADADLEPLKTMSQLQQLSLHNCQKITDKTMENVGALHGLRVLNCLSCSNLTDKGAQHLAPLIHLVHLNFEGCNKLTDSALVHFRNMLQLQTLMLNSAEINGTGLGSLERCTKLEELHLRYCPLNQTAGDKLAKLVSLTTLDVDNCPNMGGFLALATLINLKNFHLCDANVTDAELACVRTMPQLRHLDVHYCQNVTDGALVHLEHHRYLEVLDAKDTQITAAGMTRLQRVIPTLKIVSYGMSG